MANNDPANLRSISDTLEIEYSSDESRKKTGKGESADKNATHSSAQRIIKTICIYIVFATLVSGRKGLNNKNVGCLFRA